MSWTGFWKLLGSLGSFASSDRVRVSRSILIFPMTLAFIAAEPLLAQGMELRFQIENTPSAMKEMAQGAMLLELAGVLFLAAALLSFATRAHRSAMILLLSPLLAILAALADTETLIPFLLAFLGSITALVGLIVAIVFAIKNRARTFTA